MSNLTEYHLGYNRGIKAWVLFRPSEEMATQIYVGNTKSQAIHAAARELEGSGSFLCIYDEEGQLEEQRQFRRPSRAKDKSDLSGLPPQCREELFTS